MNFFQAQDQARRKNWKLGVLFAAAVLCLILLTNLLVVLLYMFTASGTAQAINFSQAIQNIPTDTWVFVSIGVLGVIAVASAFKFLSLRGGGRAIAESLGGRRLIPTNANTQEQRLLNVVEEMAIAAGISVPPVYLIPEPSINAFAAGFSPDDAVIGINQGTLDLLNRDELQGVVAHEFSHILNGDTRINLRLIAILHGILFIGMIGYGIMRSGGFSRRNGLPVVALGVGLLVVGYGGTFFGNLIKAAVSRQREFLADASAVQYTRNPDGIADALKKIGGASSGSFLNNAAAEQASHMFFGAAAKKFASSMFATHPPLADRISAIQPNWDGKFLNTGGASISNQRSMHATHASRAEAPGLAPLAAAEAIVAQVGRPDQTALDHAQATIERTNSALRDAVHDSFDAQAVVFAMLTTTEDAIGQQQLELLMRNCEAGMAQRVVHFSMQMRNASAPQKLTLLELSIPTLKTLSHRQYKQFMQTTAQLITADTQVDVFEWVLHRVLTKDLYGHFEGPQNYHGRIKNLARMHNEISQILSMIAVHGSSDPKAQIAAYTNAMTSLNMQGSANHLSTFDYEIMNAALGRLRKLTPLAKPALIKACVLAALHDGNINDDEYALLQGIAATLDCPLPARLQSA